MEDLNFYLHKIKWLHKGSLYLPHIEDVRVQTEVKNPKISIVVISFEFNNQIIENLKSIENQRYNNFELIFVNNGKPDKEFISVLPYVDIYLRLNINTGAYKARNVGSIYAQAPILLFLEDDGIADKCLIEGHLQAFDKYELISVRGACKPLTNNKYNILARHYYPGNKPFPMYANLEGNSSYDAKAFYSVGGWSDDINFGYGGAELSLRLTAKYPNRALQIYSPKPVIFHDYARNEEHLIIKSDKQRQSWEKLKNKYHNWEEFIKSWEGYGGKSYFIRRRKNIYNLPNYFLLLTIEPLLQVAKILKKLIRTKVFKLTI